MHTVRRLYVYVLSGVSLGVLLVGLNLLITVALDALGLGRGAYVGGSPGTDREQLSLAAALTVVGLLVWGVHWRFAERSVRAGAPGAAEEQGSTLRALYLTVVMAVLLAFGSIAGLNLLQALVARVLGVSAGGVDVAGSTATLVVTAAAWSYHAWIRMRDLEVPVTGPAAWIPRLYLYGAALVALGLLASALGRLLEAALSALVAPADAIGRGRGLTEVAAEAVGSIATWTIVWLGHWWYASRLTTLPGWRGEGERVAYLRVAYFAAVIAGAAAGVLWFVADALRAVLLEILDVAPTEGVGSEPLTLLVGGPLLWAAIWLAVVLVHRSWMRTEAAEHGPPGRDAAVDRLDAGTLALIGLAFGSVGAAWILGIVIDIVLGGSRTVGDAWRVDLARYAAFAVVGIGPWIWNMARLQHRVTADPVAEAASPIRRAGLLLVIGASVISGIGSLALVLYRAFGALFGAGLSGSVSELSAPISALVVAGAVAVYHAILLRRDQRLRAETETRTPAPVVTAASWPLVLTGPAGTDLEGTLSVLRANLPPGVHLDAADPDAQPVPRPDPDSNPAE